MAWDGIELISVARVTVRANIERLVGGAGEETTWQGWERARSRP